MTTGGIASKLRPDQEPVIRAQVFTRHGPVGCLLDGDTAGRRNSGGTRCHLRHKRDGNAKRVSEPRCASAFERGKVGL